MDALHRGAFRRFAYHYHPRYRGAHARDVARCRHLRVRHGRSRDRTLAPIGPRLPWGTWPVGLADRRQNAPPASRRWLLVGGKRKGGSSDVALPPMCRNAEGIGAARVSHGGRETLAINIETSQQRIKRRQDEMFVSSPRISRGGRRCGGRPWGK